MDEDQNYGIYELPTPPSSKKVDITFSLKSIRDSMYTNTKQRPPNHKIHISETNPPNDWDLIALMQDQKALIKREQEKS